MNNIQLYLGKSENILKKIEENSIDLIVSDPPYGYSFMGKGWDKVVIPSSTWKECLRILKPGAFAFIMSAPRQDVLGRMIYNLQEAGFETGFTSIYWTYACLSEDTKILTEEGLKEMNEITNKDIVYSLDTKTNLLIKSKIKKIFIYPFEGKLFNLKNQNTDQLLTLNHKILCKNKHHSGMKTWWETDWKYIEAKDLKHNYALKIPISAKYKGSKRIGKKLANLLGWILSEGHYQKDCNSINIYQSDVHKNYINEIRNLLIDLKIPYSEYKRKRIYKLRFYIEHQFYIGGKWATKIKKLIPDKQPTQKLLDLVYSERLELYNSLIKGDGSRHLWNNKNVDCFYQNNERFLDWFEILVLSLGWQTKRNRNKQCVNIKKQSDTEFQWTNYCPKLVNYKGKVWCIETKIGNFIAWRNERYFITGNSGFPKSENISLHIDKQECKKELKEKLGREPTKEEFEKEWKDYREIVNKNPNHRLTKGGIGDGHYEGNWSKENAQIHTGEGNLTKSKSDKAKEFEGSFGGFQPKPAVEIIIVCMKPLSEKNYIEQAKENGKGITHLDDCRIPHNEETKETNRQIRNESQTFSNKSCGFKSENLTLASANPKGRFPANLLVSDDVLNDGKITKGVRSYRGLEHVGKHGGICDGGNLKDGTNTIREHNDSGSFSRYFDLDAWAKENNISKDYNTFPFLICPKASKNEKNKGCENLEKKECQPAGLVGAINKGTEKPRENRQNFHPTVKPIKLMSYLITLGSKKNDIILDPFMGSGTTGVACKLLGRKFIGIELSEDYLKIAQERIKNVKSQN